MLIDSEKLKQMIEGQRQSRDDDAIGKSLQSMYNRGLQTATKLIILLEQDTKARNEIKDDKLKMFEKMFNDVFVPAMKSHSEHALPLPEDKNERD